MKKTIFFLVAICLLVVFVGCSNSEDDNNKVTELGDFDSDIEIDDKEKGYLIEQGIPEYCVDGFDPEIEQCIIEEAIKEKDIKVCDLIVYVYKAPSQTFEEAKEMWFGPNVDTCIARVAEAVGNVELCDKIVKESLFKVCIQNLAQKLQDPDICEKLTKRIPDANVKTCKMIAAS